jgi:long-chain-alcohol oxidase
VETKGMNDTTLIRSLKDKGLTVTQDAHGAMQHCHHGLRVCGGDVAATAMGHKVIIVEKGDYFMLELISTDMVSRTKFTPTP